MVNTKERDRKKRTIITKPKKVSKKQKKLYALAGGFIALIMIFSGFLYALASNPDSENPDVLERFEFNGFEFIQHVQGHFVVDYPFANRIIPISFYVDPREAEEIKITDNVRFLNNANKVYISLNPNMNRSRELSAASIEFARVLPFSGSNFNSNNVIMSFTEDTTPINEMVPIRNCDNSYYLEPVVIFEIKEGISPRVYAKNSCIFVQADTYEGLLLASDRFAYGVLGIIPFKDFWTD